MQNRKIISILIILIAIFSSIATISGIFTNKGTGGYEFKSINNQIVTIYGKGVYENMSADVAIQGIAQDFVTLFMGLPLLLISLLWTKKNTLKSKLFLAGVLNYFFLTYLFYMNMAMYNKLFLIYIILVSTSFFAFILTLLNIDIKSISQQFKIKTPTKFIGIFLMILSSMIALLWLSVIIPPLIDGSIVPKSVEHYTTLTVQGFDLSIFLPIAFISGLLLIQKRQFGYLMSSVTLVFLSLLMSALVAKIIAMALADVNVVPAVFIIPCFLIVSVISAFILFQSITRD
ncbi:MAG: hypothetical protein UR43_C0026G0006 [candidate division TM6 bacterium GW2011_GWF2_33_332]|nr:MAG: hypothetical protein UR43_C0026G0006 [candidate division TM6 bacterium GW2011_GWF2_33_332]